MFPFIFLVQNVVKQQNFSKGETSPLWSRHVLLSVCLKQLNENAFVRGRQRM